jgi:thiamine-monophosphate kinase
VDERTRTDLMKPPDRLRDWGEDRLVARLIRGLPAGDGLIVGPGDDCAVLAPPPGGKHQQLLKTDAVVEGVHFLATSPPAAVGWKAAARAVSDIAAMGGWPTHAVVTVIAPGTTAAAWLLAVYRGLARCARTYGFSLAGGETCGVPDGTPVMLNVTMLGEIEPGRCLRRCGGRPGDVIFVTGRLGGSFASGRHLLFRPRLAEARWLARHVRPSAMMDLSDGLGQDLPRLARASGTGWTIDPARLPCHRGCTPAEALGDGEDFELLFTVPRRRAVRLPAAWREAFPRVPLTAIGTLEPAGGEDPPLCGGYEHFRTLRPVRSRPDAAAAGRARSAKSSL